MAKFGVSVTVTEASTVQKPQYENLPKGTYRLQLEAAEIIEKNIGQPDHSIMLKSTFEVLEPEDYATRKLFGNYNLKNKSAVAQQIGNDQFQCLLRALELGSVEEDSETDDLLFIAFMADVALGKDSKTKNADGSPEYPGRPEIKKYYFPDEGDLPEPKVETPVAANDNTKAANTNTRTAPAPAAAKPAGTKPWNAKKAAA